MTNILYNPAHLFIGDEQTTQEHIICELLKLYCVQPIDNQGCTQCLSCTNIANKTESTIYWFAPERQYTLEDIDIILEMSRFRLEEGTYRFFIIQQAEQLTDATANRLLKTIEEPAPGYFYFFTSSQSKQVLSTIVSRCIQHVLAYDQEPVDHELIIPFMTYNFNDPITFLKTVETSTIQETQTQLLTEQIFTHLVSEYKKAYEEQNQERIGILSRIIIVVEQALQDQPALGGAKLFWKNLYVQCHSIQNN